MSTNILVTLLKMFYKGKDQNDPDVQLRAPIDIFVLINELEKLEKENEELKNK